MKYLKKVSLLAIAALIPVVPILMVSHLVGASGTAALSLSPASTTVAQGGMLDLAIHEDSGSDTVNAAHVVLTYSSNLTFTSIDNSNDFSVAASSSGGNGTVTVDRGTCGGCAAVSGDKIVATVHFKANSGGTGSVNFDPSSVVIRSVGNQAEAMTYTGGTYTITSLATMSLSPASKTVTQGDSLDVAVYEDSATDGVNGVQANLSYPSNLNFVSITSSPVWPVEAQSSGTGGVVKIGRGISPGSPPLTGKQLVATIRFSAASPGTAQIGFVTGTALIRAVDNSVEPTNNIGGGYSIVAAVSSGSTSPKPGSPPPAPKSVTKAVSTPVSSGGPAVSAPVTSAADTTAPTISDIQVTNLSTSSATVNWRTSELATSEVDYGLSTKLILSTTDSKLALNHSLALNSKELVGHKTYHFVIKSTDASGNLASSKDLTFSTGGVQVTTTEIAAAAGAALLGGGIWLAAAGGLKLGGGMAVSAGGIYKEPKPIIVGGGSPPPTIPVVQPQTAQPPAAAPAQEPQTPGKVVGPKSSPVSQTDNQTLPKWVKK